MGSTVGGAKITRKWSRSEGRREHDGDRVRGVRQGTADGERTGNGEREILPVGVLVAGPREPVAPVTHERRPTHDERAHVRTQRQLQPAITNGTIKVL